MLFSRKKLYLGVKKTLDQIKVDFGGGCSLEKAFTMTWLIAKYRIKTSVDIGVYRGRSLFPQAYVHKYYTNGVVYGVDPWTKSDAIENDTEYKDLIKKFIKKTDFQKIFEEVCDFNKKNSFEKNCILIRKKSKDAIKDFIKNKTKLDLVHIDGNHDIKLALNDVKHYFPLLNKNGFIILDDVSWKSVKPAYRNLERKMNLIYIKIDHKNDYAIFWNNKSKIKNTFLKYCLKRLLDKKNEY